MILSLQDMRTTADALPRSGLACLASQGRLHHAWRPAYGGRVAGSSSAFAPTFGHLAGLAPVGIRAFAPLRQLDSSANQEEGGP